MTRKRGSLAIAMSILVHASLLALLLRTTPSLPPASPGLGAMGVSLIDGKTLLARSRLAALPRAPAHATPTSTKPPNPPRPQPPPDIPPQYINLEPPADEARLGSDPAKDVVAVSVADAAGAAAGKTCQIGAWLQAALQADPSVHAALTRVPRSSRSVANAIMIWDVRWVPQPPAAVDGASVIRSALMVGVRSAPAACLTQLVRGPELLILSDDSGATILAIGSGEWSWADLLADEPASHLVAATEMR